LVSFDKKFIVKTNDNFFIVKIFDKIFIVKLALPGYHMADFFWIGCVDTLLAFAIQF